MLDKYSFLRVVEDNPEFDCRLILKFGKNTDKKEIYPDIIVHQRKIKNNLIAIEMKKTTSRNTDKIKDIEKLEALTDRKNDYHYTLGIYFELDITDNNNIINFFVDGEVI